MFSNSENIFSDIWSRELIILPAPTPIPGRKKRVYLDAWNARCVLLLAWTIWCVCWGGQTPRLVRRKVGQRGRWDILLGRMSSLRAKLMVKNNGFNQRTEELKWYDWANNVNNVIVRLKRTESLINITVSCQYFFIYS